MSISSTINRVLSGKSLRKKAREERRRKTMNETRRRRLFEALEDRQMLDAASLYGALPEVITIADPNSYHYAYEGKPNSSVDESTVAGLTTSFIEGSQVAFTIMKTSTNGAVSSLGEIVIQLFESDGEAPNSSSRFIQLCNEGYYNGLTFHRIIPGFMFQGGSSDGYGREGSDLGSVDDEYSDVLTHSSRGIVAFANANKPGSGIYNTSNAQFYITFEPAEWLDGGYNVFGYVVSGYETIDAMENAATQTITHPTYGTTVQNFPVDTYKISNMRVLGADDQTHSALRIVADENASGKTTISFSSNLADDALKFNETTVYVGQEGLTRYVSEALANYNFEIAAGERVDVSLPTNYGGYEIQYQIAPASEPDGYTIDTVDPKLANFSLVSTAAGGLSTSLTITASLIGGSLTTDVEQSFSIKPSTPTVVLLSSDATKVGDLDGGVKIISSNLADSPLDVAVSFFGSDPGVSTRPQIEICIDNEEYAYTVKSHTYDLNTRIDSYVLTLSLKDYQALSDGMHSLRAREYVSTNAYSEPVLIDFMVDSTPLSFLQSEKTIDINVGDQGMIQLNTNKSDEYGVERSDVKFSLANPSAGPRFISLTDGGVFSWSGATDDDCGVYYVEVNATDALGVKASSTLTLNVGFVPIFNPVASLSVETGSELRATVSAYVPSAEPVGMRYEIVGAFQPSGMTIDSDGNLTWDVPANYISNENIRERQVDVTVRATSRLEQSDGSVIDGASTEKTVALTIVNSNYNEETGELVWTPVVNQTTRAGETFAVRLHAEAEGSTGMLYELTSAPTGMTIGPDGTVSWSVPSDYFGSDAVKSEPRTITAKATAIISSDETGTNYGASSTQSFTLTIENPDYVDYAPEFAEIENTETAPGGVFEATISATDPNRLADRIDLELVGDYPDDLDFNSTTGALRWTIPADYLASSVAYRVMNVKVRATEQYLIGESYEPGLSAEKTFEIVVRNDEAFDAEGSITPIWNPILAQEVFAGQTFTLSVSATAEGALPGSGSSIGGDAGDETKEYQVCYELDGLYPDGMTIDDRAGVISWDVPADLFSENEESETFTIRLKATTILDETSQTVDYGGSAPTSFVLKVNNPNHVDTAPRFADLTPFTAATGTTYTATISAVDPEGEADRIVYELVGTGYPEEFNFDPATGVISWAIPDDYLASDVEAQTFAFKIKATEQYLQEDETYRNGLSTEKTFELLVANSGSNVEEIVKPVFETIAAQSVVAGATFNLTVVATASKETAEGETISYAVEYSLTDGAPEGMTIDSSTGAISWEVPENYFSSNRIESETLTIAVMAKTVVGKDGDSTNYGGSEEQEFSLTVTNPNYDSERANWQDWFDDWVQAAQDRYDGHARNLKTYLDAYLKAIDNREKNFDAAKADVLAAKAEYDDGALTLTQFLNKRDSILSGVASTYEAEIAEARNALEASDAAVEQAYLNAINSLDKDFKALEARSESGEIDKPAANIKEQAEKAAGKTVGDAIERETGSAHFRFVGNSTGAHVATDLQTVLKIWRQGYSYQTVYNEVFSDILFTDSLNEETAETPSGESSNASETETPPAEGGDSDQVYIVDGDEEFVI